MVVLCVSGLLFLCGVAVALFNRGEAVRAIYAVAMLAWTGYLMMFHLDILSRTVASSKPQGPFACDFGNGMHAYKAALFEVRISMCVLMFAASIVMMVPRWVRPRTDAAHKTD